MNAPNGLGAFWRRTRAIAVKETKHILRDVRSLITAFLMPVMLILLFGFGVSFDLDHVPLAVSDASRTAQSRDLIRSVFSSRDFLDAGELSNADDAVTLFRRNQAAAAMTIPYDYAERLARGETATVQFLIDGSDGSSAQAVLGMSMSAIRAENQRIAPSRAPVSADVTVLYNPALRSQIFLVPGLVGYVMALAAVLLTALTVAREYERGNMEQLFATPVRSFEIVLGKLSPYLVIGHVQALLVLTLGMGVFDVPMRGNLFVLGVAVFLFLLGSLGQGLLISIATRNQQLATMGAALTTLLPVMILSGFLFPISNMPAVLQVITYVFPARYFMAILRGVFLKGVGFAELWPQFVGLIVFAVAVIGLSKAKFKRSMA